MVSELGPAMIPIGSYEGFLTRYLDNDPHAMDLDRIWGDAIKQMLHEQGLSLAKHPFAPSRYSSLHNSREIPDLKEGAKIGDDAIIAHLSSVFQAALKGLKAPSITLQVPPEV